MTPTPEALPPLLEPDMIADPCDADGAPTAYYRASTVRAYARAALAARPQEQPTKAERVTAIVNAGPFPGMSEAFDAHMGAACWTDPAYAPDASMWAAAWKAAKGQRPAAQAVEPVAVKRHSPDMHVVGPNDGGLEWIEELRPIPVGALLYLAAATAAQPQAQPLVSDKDRPGATYVEGFGYVDTRAVRAIERHHRIGTEGGV